jgi:hypothetical protein
MTSFPEGLIADLQEIFLQIMNNAANAYLIQNISQNIKSFLLQQPDVILQGTKRYRKSSRFML